MSPRASGAREQADLTAAAQRDPRRSAPTEDELIMHLERDQLVSETSRPLERAALGRRATVAVWALRAFVVIVGAMVVYTFIDQLH